MLTIHLPWMVLNLSTGNNSETEGSAMAAVVIFIFCVNKDDSKYTSTVGRLGLPTAFKISILETVKKENLQERIPSLLHYLRKGIFKTHMVKVVGVVFWSALLKWKEKANFCFILILCTQQLSSKNIQHRANDFNSLIIVTDLVFLVESSCWSCAIYIQVQVTSRGSKQWKNTIFKGSNCDFFIPRKNIIFSLLVATPNDF